MLSIRPFLVLHCSLLVIVSAEFGLPDCQGSTKPYFDSDDLEKFKVGNRSASWDQLLKMKMDTIIRRSFRRTIMSIPDMIEANGYPVEVHTVKTIDGYLLTSHRIPYSPKLKNASSNKIPVLLTHSLFHNAHAWIFRGTYESLAYILADAGYDVWMLNARGTRYSQKHISLSPSGRKSKQFWAFSWHEIGIYDLPSNIDYILAQTNHTKLHYVGYSQGCNTFFAMASVLPEYNNKIILNTAIAPSSQIRLSPVIRRVSEVLYKLLKSVVDNFGVHYFQIGHPFLIEMATAACTRTVQQTSSHITCRLLVLLLVQTNTIGCSELPLIIADYSASMRTLLHYLQVLGSGEFKQYDYDNVRKNEAVYGQRTAPLYNLTKVTAPTMFYTSRADKFLSDADISEMSSQLPNFLGNHVVVYDDFQHTDFLFNTHLRELVYEKLVSAMKEADDGYR